MFQNLKEPSWPSEWKERWLTQEGSKIRREGGYLRAHKVLKDQGKVATSQDTQRSGEGGYIPHKILTDQGGWLTKTFAMLSAPALAK